VMLASSPNSLADGPAGLEREAVKWDVINYSCQRKLSWPGMTARLSYEGLVALGNHVHGLIRLYAGA
jgi:hypothetical protein